MNRPLYAGIDESLQLGSGHAGLWFDKFFNKWPDSYVLKDDKEAKSNWLKTLADKRGEKKAIQEAVIRQENLTHAQGGRVLRFTSISRFVTGLGRSHPVENGFAWHATLGTPYLPGSSLKGLVRAFAKTEEEMNNEQLNALFGGKDCVGQWIFLDVLPTQAVFVEVDVLTPHYAGWTPDKAPGDWMSPSPVPFLVTAANTPWQVAILPRANADEKDLEKVTELTVNALKWLGAGAKTAVGYGRMNRNEDAESKMQKARKERVQKEQDDRAKQAKHNALNPFERELEALSQNQSDANYTIWIKAVEDKYWPDAETQLKVLAYAEKVMREQNLWRPNARNRRSAGPKWTANVLELRTQLKGEKS